MNEEIKHIGNMSERRNIHNLAEKIYAEEWEIYNGVHRHTLANLLSISGYDNFLTSISQRDAFVAATIIQWLGTNVGQGFIEFCEKKITEQKPANKIAINILNKLQGRRS